jgi:hypothetical protein
MTDEDRIHIRMPTPPEPVCDFCSSPDVHWTFPALDFISRERKLTAMAIGIDQPGIDLQHVNLQSGSRGGWTACNVCAALIRRGDRERLVRRSAKREQRRQRERGAIMSLANLIDLIRPLQDQFWENRQGDPIHHDTHPTEDPTK